MDERPPLDAMRHAYLARELIKACKGLVVCENISRVSRSQLSNYCDPDHTSHMPADVITALEGYCRRPIYSREIYEAATRAGETSLQDLFTEACEAAEAFTRLQHFVRVDLRGGGINRLGEGKRRELAHLLVLVAGESRDVLVAGDRVLG